jgi:hypothetical protein
MQIIDSTERSTSQKKCLQVLRYWHQLEFFTPYNLDDAISQGEPAIDISLSSLQSEKADQFLPWLKKTEKLFHYNIYLLPFDKKELTELSNRYFPIEFSQQNEIELQEKLEDEGLTCFARLFVDKHGIPKWNDLSISTLPWAMGMLQSGDFEKLSENNHSSDMTLLKSALKLLEEQNQGQFDARWLLYLLKVLCQWARFSPNYPFVIKIKPIPAKQETQIDEPIKALPSNLPMPEHSQEDLKEEEETIEEDQPLNILNSFYIRDLEKTLNHLANEEHPVLSSYINGSAEEKKDILTNENLSFLLQTLRPNRTNIGRWPSSNKNMMSLMQQVCINHAFESQTKHPVIATNGPPGTGKTTLLKDIIADNIVQRAKILASFTTVNSCFMEKKTIAIGENKTHIRPLRPELTGFEMLVVSSNNIAVENITRELPLKNKLDKNYQKSCRYLQPVAAKLAANHYNQSVKPIQESLQPWGLIAIALGKSANRLEFVERFFKNPDRLKNMEERKRKGEYLTIWEWRDQYRGCSFAQAKTAFHQALAKVDAYKDELQEYARLHEEIALDQWTQKISALHQSLETIIQKRKQLESDKKQKEQLLIEKEKHQNTLYREIEQQFRFKPGFWKRLFRTQEFKTFNQVTQNLQTHRLQLTQEIVRLQNEISQLSKYLIEKNTQYSHESNTLNDFIHQQQKIQQRYAQLKARFPAINVPRDIIDEHDQVNSFWQSEEFNQLRSQLFIQAMQLHEAWLAEALQKKLFGGNLFAINTLLDNKHPLAPSDELIIWQSLFIMIPVVSSTFASIGKQFKNIGAQALGWLLIDEAGQAIPQAAVGALWRCKKAIVVGDPRQIEPIMTLPPHLIEGIGKYHFSENALHWSPHLTSIQKLADHASTLGSMSQINQQQEWIGIPLLVHRRCMEPMFSIANEIAYENKMINARQIALTNSPESSWFDVSGGAIDKQYVPEQGQCALQLFIHFYNYDQGLPRLFIITPFKKIRKYLKELIQNQSNWLPYIDPSLLPPTRKEMSHWVHKHIGTVHTFQGKENEKVLFVLGADKEQKGAIRWASSKPNLLNVALTRATDRIYIIGDWDLWANRRYFSQASSVLVRKTMSGSQ